MRFGRVRCSERRLGSRNEASALVDCQADNAGYDIETGSALA